jgi:hypothetical protein
LPRQFDFSGAGRTYIVYELVLVVPSTKSAELELNSELK